MRCERCGEDGPLELHTGGEATIGTVAGVLERRPVVTCPAGHRTTPPPVRQAAGQAVEEQVARARSRWRRRDVCAACRAPLTLPARRTGRTTTVVTEVAPVHTIHLDLPMVRCGDCGQDQVPSRSQDDVARVIAALYEPPTT
jgi:hypothetical protein